MPIKAFFYGRKIATKREETNNKEILILFGEYISGGGSDRTIGV